jgi:hypothetical protein
MSFEPGDTVVVQEVWRDRVWAARPMTVVQDTHDFVVLWFPRGTLWKRPIVPPARHVDGSRAIRLASCLELGDWAFEDAEWDVSTLWLMRAGDWHAQWVSWLEDGSHWGWYVNLQEPFRRTARGFETMDLVLDVLIDPDRSWRWKDEDELETFVEMGVLDEALADRARAEGLRVAGRAERNEPPFDEPWPDWRPDPGWATPELSAGWEQRWR